METVDTYCDKHSFSISVSGAFLGDLVYVKELGFHLKTNWQQVEWPVNFINQFRIPWDSDVQICFLTT